MFQYPFLNKIGSPSMRRPNWQDESQLHFSGKRSDSFYLVGEEIVH